VFVTLRRRLPLGGLTECIICLAPWCAALLFLLERTPAAPLVWVLAIAGGALMLGSYTGATQQ